MDSVYRINYPCKCHEGILLCMRLNKLNIKTMESRALCYTGAAEWWTPHILARSVLCHTEKLEANQRVSVCWLTCQLLCLTLKGA